MFLLVKWSQTSTCHLRWYIYAQLSPVFATYGKLLGPNPSQNALLSKGLSDAEIRFPVIVRILYSQQEEI